jgi:pseudaminic acid cytidylyltransferase
MKLAIIPARGGSKRIPRKNIKPFAGRPMIEYAIAAAYESGLFGQIVVSTDDDEIAAVATAAGAQVPFRRPAALADDHSPTLPVIADAIEHCALLGWVAEAVCCIYPAVPMLRAADLVAAWELLARGGAEYVFPVVAFPSPIQRALRREADGLTRPLHPEFTLTRTQDLESAYHDAGQFYWGRTEAWRAGLDIHTHARTIVLPEWRSVDIDTPDDWRRAEALHRLAAEFA